MRRRWDSPYFCASSFSSFVTASGIHAGGFTDSIADSLLPVCDFFMRGSCEHARAKINAKDTTNSLGYRIFPPPFLFHVADPDFDPFFVFQQRRKQAGIGFFNKNALLD